TIADLVRHRLRSETLITKTSREEIATTFGPLVVHTYRSIVDNAAYTAFVFGALDPNGDVLVRVHRATPTTDLLARLVTRETDPVNLAYERIAREGRGVGVSERDRCPPVGHVDHRQRRQENVRRASPALGERQRALRDLCGRSRLGEDVGAREQHSRRAG